MLVMCSGSGPLIASIWWAFPLTGEVCFRYQYIRVFYALFYAAGPVFPFVHVAIGLICVVLFGLLRK